MILPQSKEILRKELLHKYKIARQQKIAMLNGLSENDTRIQVDDLRGPRICSLRYQDGRIKTRAHPAITPTQD